MYRTRWIGTIPTVYQITDTKITNEFIDGRTLNGAWAIMHPDAHKKYGCGLGTGRGQKYRLVVQHDDKSWVKVEG